MFALRSEHTSQHHVTILEGLCKIVMRHGYETVMVLTKSLNSLDQSVALIYNSLSQSELLGKSTRDLPDLVQFILVHNTHLT